VKNDLAAYLFFFASDTDLENTLQEFFHIIKINSGDIKSGGDEDSWRVHIGVKYFLIEHILFHDSLITLAGTPSEKLERKIEIFRIIKLP
jgi:hypothetical protein